MAPSFAAGSMLLLASLATVASELHPLSDEFISLINSQQDFWEAGRNFPIDTPMAYIKNLMGVVKDGSKRALPVKKHNADLIGTLPEYFDPREKWPNCPSLHEIRDQGNCGSCWAHGAVEVMTDRVCIYAKGKKQFHYSAADLISCVMKDGCHGKWPSDAFEQWVKQGIVSGGNYSSSEGCMPYLIAPCEHFMEGKRKPCVRPYVETPKCVPKCRTGYNVEYKNDKHRGKKVYSVRDEDHIKAELFKNGPVEAIIQVYYDFLHYKSGVYTRSNDTIVGLHAIKMLGWGVEGGKKYWLMANSWNSDWGDKGYFKILRGKNECGVEDSLVTGEPDLDGI